MLFEGEWVRLTKQKSIHEPYQEDIVNGYFVEGKLLRNISVGSCILVERVVRNGTVAYGLFNTSIVKELWDKNGECFVTTENSVYKITSLEGSYNANH